MATVFIDNKREKKYVELNMTDEKLRQGSFIKKKEEKTVEASEPDAVEPKSEEIHFEWDLGEAIETSTVPEKKAIEAPQESESEPVTNIQTYPMTTIVFLKDGESLNEGTPEQRMKDAQGALLQQAQKQMEDSTLHPEKTGKTKKRSGLRRILGF